MKNAFLFLALITCLFTGAIVPQQAPAAVSLPDPIANAFSGPAWEGWTPTVLDDEATLAPLGIHGAVIMSKEGRNVLCILENWGGNWIITRQTALAIYQGERLPTISFAETSPLVSRMVITYDLGSTGQEAYVWNLSNGSPDMWTLETVLLSEPGRGNLTNYVRLTYMPTHLRIGEGSNLGPRTDNFYPEAVRIFARLNRRIGNFDINAYPRSIAEAYVKLDTPPALSPGEQQDPLPAGIPAEVLPGLWRVTDWPGDREEQQKIGLVNPDSTVKAIGAEGAFAMISFEEAGATRFGYVPLNALAPVNNLPELRFASLWADQTVSHATDEMTEGNGPDGPILLNTSIPMDRCLYLATLGSDWAYVEWINTQSRSFVSSDELNIFYDLNRPVDPEFLPKAMVSQDVDVIDDPYRRAIPKVLGQVKANDIVSFVDTLYGDWACIQITKDGQILEGYIPRNLVNPLDGVGLDGNG